MSADEKRVLVTGGSGLIGRAIQNLIEDEKPEDETWIFGSSRDADLRNTLETESLFAKHRPTHVIHLAASMGGLYSHLEHGLQFLRDNVHIDDNVLYASHEIGVRKLVSCLSNCIFPDKVSYPIDETMIHDGPPPECHTGFAYAKRLLDVQSRAYRAKYGCQFTSVIPVNVFGPHGNFSTEEGHVIPSLIAKTCDAKSSGKPLEIWGTGRSLRQFIYSADVARLIVWVLREYEETDPIILSVDESDEISIRELVQVITRIAGYQGSVVFDATKTDGQFKKTLNNAKMRRYLPTFQFTPFEEAVRATVDWYERHKETARK